MDKIIRGDYMSLKFKCKKCDREYNIDTHKYKCDCGGLFGLKGKISRAKSNLDLGEGNTPILKKEFGAKNVYFKMDYFQPTGSFKDRGAVFLVDQIKKSGINKIIDDSSGNAGAAIAAYSAAANIDCSIYLPVKTSKAKIKQIKDYGADIIKIKGDRDKTSKAILKAAQKNYYASHVYNPLFFAGVASLAFEIKEEIGIPDKIIVPVGNGTMLLGLYYGFKEIGKFPELIAVQSEKCSPIYNSFYNKNLSLKKNKKCNKTIAEGIAIGQPQRLKEIIEVIKITNGDVIIVSEEEIKVALNKLWRKGIYIEKTSAVAPAGFLKLDNNNSLTEKEKIVIPLTGTGLKNIK